MRTRFEESSVGLLLCCSHHRNYSCLPLSTSTCCCYEWPSQAFPSSTLARNSGILQSQDDQRRAALEGCNKEGIWYKRPLYRSPLSATLFNSELVEQLFQQLATQAKSVLFLIGFSRDIKRKSTSFQSRNPSKKGTWSRQRQFTQPQQVPMYSQLPQQEPVPSGQTPQSAFPQQQRLPAFYANAKGAFSPHKRGDNCRRGSGRGKASSCAFVTPAFGSQRQF